VQLILGALFRADCRHEALDDLALYRCDPGHASSIAIRDLMARAAAPDMAILFWR
jgi:hypothetical protein